MRRILIWSGAGLCVLLLAASAFLVNLIWFKPLFIDHFFERVFVEILFEEPELATRTRALKAFGLRFYHDDLGDKSDDKTRAQLARLRKNLETLRSYEEEGLSEQQLLSKRVLDAFLSPQVELEAFAFHDYPLNQLFGYQNMYPSFMAINHWVEDRYDAEAYISRLKKVDTAFQQLIEGIQNREKMGITPPTFVVDRVLDNVRGFLSESPKDNTLASSFAKKLEKTDLSEEAQTKLYEMALKAVEEDVYGAYRKIETFLVGFRSRTNTDDGVWKLPEGERFYDLKLWEMTTTRMSATAIHQRGLAEVDRIQKEMLAILEGQGYDVSEGFLGAMEALTEDDRHYFEDSDEGRAQILDRYRAIIEEIEGKLEPYFNLRHKATVEVLRVPEFREATAPGAYYQPPSLDGSQPGRFFANLYDIRATPKWGMKTLAYHEAVPGHHLQLAVASEIENVPTFRRVIPFTAFAEGWALYAERLAYEMGLESDPLDNLGRLQAELFRAVRLVVDTGLHRFKWTRERAIEYMLAHLGMAESDVVAEVERYIVLPAQATAYKVGLDFILAQRARARAALGEAFDIRAFHDAVLQNGAMPLSILEEQISKYIESNKGPT